MPIEVRSFLYRPTNLSLTAGRAEATVPKRPGRFSLVVSSDRFRPPARTFVDKAFGRSYTPSRAA